MNRIAIPVVQTQNKYTLFISLSITFITLTSRMVGVAVVAVTEVMAVVQIETTVVVVATEAMAVKEARITETILVSEGGTINAVDTIGEAHTETISGQCSNLL